MRRLLPLLLLAACQPVPHPFAGLSDRSVPPLKPPDAVGILVAPVTGAPKEAGDELAKSLRDDDVPASTESGNKESFRLESRATSAPTGGRETLQTSVDRNHSRVASLGEPNFFGMRWNETVFWSACK